MAIFVGDHREDVIQGSNEDDIIDGKAGKDIIHGNGGDDFIYDSDGIPDIIRGGDGFDFISFLDSPEGMHISIEQTFGGTSFGDVLTDIEGIGGTAYGDLITGSSDDNILDGAQGKDLIYGKGGDDFFLDFDDSRDLIWGGDGSDTVMYFTLTGVGMSVDLMKGITDRGDYLYSVENVIGTIFADNIKGNWSDNIIDGGLGKDQMHGYGGDDTFVDYDESRDLIWAGWAGSDTVSYWGSSQGVTVTLGDVVFSDWRTAEVGSSSFDDYLSGVENVTGTDFSDNLSGNYKSNILIGGLDRDILTGGDGGDIFLYEAIADSVSFNKRNDIITDFQTGWDTLEIAFDASIADIAISTYSSSLNEVTLAGTDFSVLVDGYIAKSDIVITA